MIQSSEEQGFESYNQIRVHFRVCPSLPCLEVKDALDRLALLPGCIDYALTYGQQNAFQWFIAGVWTNEEDRNRHYCGEQIQVLFKCLILQSASLIICSEGQILHPETENI